MAWIKYKTQKFEHNEWRELVEILRAGEEWEVQVARTINQWQSKMNPLVAYTSGSTGAPAKIHLQRNHVKNSAELTNSTFELEPGINALFCLPAKFIAGKMMIIRALVNQWNLVLVNPNADALKNINDPIAFAAMTPYQVEQSIVRFPSAFERIDKLIIGGAPIPQTLEQRLITARPICFATYGMTETITHIAVRALNGDKRSDHFSALEGVKISQDEEDCLVIKANHLDESEIVTNDVAAMDSQGRFLLLGRRDHVINSGGVKLHPESIERKIAPFLFRRYYVGAIENDQFGERPELIIEGEPFHKQVEEALLEAFAGILTSIEMPSNITYLDQFEETATGKIKRKKR